MNGPGRGARGAQTLAVAAASAAVWYIAARSLHVSLGQARAELAGAAREIEAHDSEYGAGAGDPERAMAQLGERERRVTEMAGLSADAGKVYQALGQVAGAWHVTIDRIEPARAAHDQRPAAPSGAGGPAVSVESTHYMIEASGQYADVAAFVRALGRDLGLTKVVSVRLTPAPVTPGAAPTIAASIETAHYTLTLPGAKSKEKGP